jgi:hypothetical protein
MLERDVIGYGLKNGRLTHVEEVDRGIACGCVCVACKSPLVARKGKVRKHHFAHHVSTACDGGPETALHLLAKELFQEMETVKLPPYLFSKTGTLSKSGDLYTYRPDKVPAKGGVVTIDSVSVEVRDDGFVPDIVLSSRGRQLIVEIAVTSAVDRRKLRRLRKRGLPAIEIQLDRHDALLSREELKERLIGDTTSKVWLFHPNQRTAEREFFRQMRERNKAERDLAISTPHRTATKPVLASPPAQSSTRMPASSEKVRKYLLTALESRLRYPSSGAPARLTQYYEQLIDDFRRTHNRFPTLDECLAMSVPQAIQRSRGR